MKVERDIFNRVDTHAGRKERVERTLQVFRRDGRAGFEVRHLAESVHAGVSAAGAVEANFFTGDFAERVHQRALDGRPVGLDGPAEEFVAVVGESEFEVTHARNYEAEEADEAKEAEEADLPQRRRGR